MTAVPQVTVEVGFASSGSAVTWSDVSAYVRSLSVSRQGTRQAGPLWNYSAGTASIVLKNPDGRFDPDNLAGPYCQTTQQITETFTVAGAFTWTAPANLVGTTVTVAAWAGGGGSGAGVAPYTAGGGGGGGEYASDTVGVTPGVTYSGTVGAGGTRGVAGTGTNGGNGGNSTFTGDALTVTAHGGSGGLTAGTGAPAANGGAGGFGSANATHFSGGAGGGGYASSKQVGGGGGGGSAGTSANGNLGINGGANIAGAGGAALPGGGPGGNGAVASYGKAPSAGPGGGGGGGSASGSGNHGGAPGADGQVTVSYAVTQPSTETQIRAMVPVRISATWNAVTYRLFYGYADSWTDAGINNPRYAEVTLAASDGFKVLSAITLPAIGSSGPGDDAGFRINRILDAAGWPVALRAVDSGDTTLQATTYGDTALNLMQLTADSEPGDLYMDGAGNVTFRHRQAILADYRSAIPQAVLGDSPGSPAPVLWDFETGTQGWAPDFGATVATSTAWKASGTHSLLITYTSGGEWGAGSLGQPVTPGQTYQASAVVSVPIGAPTLNAVRIQINWSDSGGFYITDTTVQQPFSQQHFLAPGQVLYLQAVGDAPAGAAFGSVNVIDFETPAAGAQLYADAVTWCKEMPYTRPVRANDDTTLYNDVQITNATIGTLQEAQDATSIAKYLFPRSYSRTDLLMQDDPTALAYAQWVLAIAADAEDRFASLDISPQRDPADLYPQVLGREIGDRIRVLRRPPSVSLFTRDCFIRGISHTFDYSSQAWQTTWTLQDATKYSGFLVLDSTTNGQLDMNALGY